MCFLLDAHNFVLLFIPRIRHVKPLFRISVLSALSPVHQFVEINYTKLLLGPESSTFRPETLAFNLLPTFAWCNEWPRSKGTENTQQEV